MSSSSKPPPSSPRSSCSIGGRAVPVTASSSLLMSQDLVDRAVGSDPFKSWVANMDRSVRAQRQRRRTEGGGGGGGELEVKSVEVQSVDLFGSRVGFVKVKAHCTMDGRVLPGICLLRGMSVGVLVALKCTPDGGSGQGQGAEEGETYSILVEQPRIPVGEARMLEIPAGMIDGSGNFTGVAAAEMEEECGIAVNERDLIDLTALAYGGDGRDDASFPGICPSGGGCDEYVRLMYLERSVTAEWLDSMRGRLTGLREHGELITLRVVKFDEIWRESCDAKALCALHLLSQLRTSGKLKPLGMPPMAGPDDHQHGDKGALPATPTTGEDPRLTMSDGRTVPQLAFGLYKVAPDECDEAISEAVRAGYRHFDSASVYGNEASVGRALRRCGLPRGELFVGGKVWNDAQRAGRAAVRESFERSLRDLDCDYLDVVYVHWPVPGHHTETYKELELLHEEGKIRSLGISNYTPQDYEELLASGITVMPVLNQIEASPVMYRRDVIDYFQNCGVVVGAFKALHRGASLQRQPIPTLAAKYGVSPAQVMLRWAVQKGLVVVSKTVTPRRMEENRSILHFVIVIEDMALLDALTTDQEIEEREKLEISRKTGT